MGSGLALGRLLVRCGAQAVAQMFDDKGQDDVDQRHGQQRLVDFQGLGAHQVGRAQQVGDRHGGGQGGGLEQLLALLLGQQPNASNKIPLGLGGAIMGR